MPIRPENRALYPANWAEVSLWIRKVRAGDHCERCGIENGTRVRRRRQNAHYYTITIVLTVAHLDHAPTNNAAANLAALCQRCHLRHDALHHAQTRRTRAAQSPLTRPFPFNEATP